MLLQRDEFIRQIINMPEFGAYPPNLRIAIANESFKLFHTSALAHRMETCFGMALCLGVGVALFAGYFWKGLFGSVLMLVLIVFSITGLNAYIVRLVWWKWIKRFLASEQCKLLADKLGQS